MGKSRKQYKKEWKARRINKINRKISRTKQNHYTVPGKKKKRIKRKTIPFFIDVPKNFSLVDNTSETVKFFESVFEIINRCEMRSRIFFNLSGVENITPDAIMYLIAVISNTKRLHVFKISCSGNVPYAENARNIIERVGFYDYVSAMGRYVKTKDPDRIRILQGKEASGTITATVCDFVNEKIGEQSFLSTKRLYPMLVELMTNVKQHAYRDNSATMNPQWYIYVENHDDDIKFVFLDSGAGIPNTIRKNWKERIKDLFGVDRDDPTYIEAALKGQFRTETQQGHRGKGLPEIYNAVNSNSNRMNDMTIISGHGKVSVRGEESIKKEYVESSMEGSVFVWNFRKGETC